MANKLDQMKQRVEKAADARGKNLDSGVLFDSLTKAIRSFTGSVNSLNKDFASSMRELVNKSSGTESLVPLPDSSPLGQAIKNIISDTSSSTQFLVPLPDSSNLSKSLQELLNKGTTEKDSGTSTSATSKATEGLQETVSQMGQSGGFWKAVLSGEVKAAWQSLVADVKEYKGVVALTAAVTEALFRESMINKLRPMTDGLERGSDSLYAFRSAIALTTITLGDDFQTVANRAVEAFKDLNMAYSSKVFKEYLQVQGEVMKATGMSDKSLNQMFYSVKSGSKSEKEFIETTKEMGKILMGLSGKAGIAKDDLDAFAKQMSEINTLMSIAGASTGNMTMMTNQFANGLKMMGQLNLVPVWTKLTSAITKATGGDDASFAFLTQLGVDPIHLSKALESGNYQQIFESFFTRIQEFSQMKNPFLDPGYMILFSHFGDQTGALIDKVKRGQLTLEMFQTLINKPPEKNNLSDILSSISHSLTVLKTSFTGMLADLGEAPLQLLGAGLHHVAEAAKGLHGVFQNMSPNAKRISSVLFTIGSGALIVVPAIKTLIGLFKTLSSILGLTSLVALIPGGPVIAGILAAVAASVVLYNSWDKIKQYVGDVKNISKAFGEDIEHASHFLKSMAEGIAQLLESVVKVYDEAGWTGIGIQLKIKMIDAIIGIKEYWQMFVDFANQSALEIAKSLLHYMGKALTWIFEKYISWLKFVYNLPSVAWDWLKNKTGFDKSTEGLKQEQQNLKQEYTEAKKDKTFDEFRTNLPKLQELVGEKNKVPTSLSSPKEFMSLMKALEGASGVKPKAGSELPEIATTVTNAGLGQSLIKFINSADSWKSLKGVSDQDKNKYYISGLSEAYKGAREGKSVADIEAIFKSIPKPESAIKAEETVKNAQLEESKKQTDIFIKFLEGQGKTTEQIIEALKSLGIVWPNKSEGVSQRKALSEISFGQQQNY